MLLVLFTDQAAWSSMSPYYLEKNKLPPLATINVAGDSAVEAVLVMQVPEWEGIPVQRTGQG
ncbi:hypothetical protein WUBG_00021 [Wuchereria bancrofti]|uniref:Uncharacterized protein n=1 Tax=Wuchereria bancrofti TaxID=6293 RepID=J9F2F4_WUCBA|nr:hypothetical protein WUBG_00021 [Wuchereria bancrofti]